LANKPVHVVPDPGKGWNVKREGASRASRHCQTQGEAIQACRNIAQRERTELSIHGKDGKIRQKDSYGNDPCPPKDKN
jgi:hypothetical protein